MSVGTNLKFRAWDVKAKEFIKGYFGVSCIGKVLQPGTGISYKQKIILMRYTGFQDKDGKEVYEGDRWERGQYIGIVKFKFGAWNLIKASDSRCYSYPYFYSTVQYGKVIGNIYEQKATQQGI